MANSSRLIALLGLLAVAGYQNRDKLSGLLGRLSGQGQAGDGPGAGNGGFLDSLQSTFGGGGNAGGGIAEGLKDLIDRFTGSGEREVAQSWIETGANQEPTPELTQTADEQKGRGADAMRGFAKAVHGAADDLGEQSPTVARYLRKAAESVEALSDTVRSRSVNDLVTAAKDTTRAHPTAFFVGAVAAGFALSRFFKSSARAEAPERRDVAHNDGSTGSRGSTRETGSLNFGGRS